MNEGQCVKIARALRRLAGRIGLSCVASLATASCWAPSCAQRAPVPAAQRNVILVTLDTTRADRTSAYGYLAEPETTPHLRALASKGVLFAHAYAPMPTTSPSHASMFTGLYPCQHGVMKNGMVLDHGIPVLADVLRQAGRQTAAFISSFPLDARFGFARGFAYYDASFEAGSSTIRPRAWQDARFYGRFDRRAGETTKRAVEWLRANGDRPFFLWVHYFDAHGPYLPPEPFRSRFGASRSNFSRSYDAEVSYADANMGTLLAELDALGLAQRTAIVVAGDHGEGLMQHGHMEHGVQLYEEAVQVPLVVVVPGVTPAALRVEEPVEVLQVAATIAELTGTTMPAASAPSLSGSWSRPPSTEARPVFLQRRHYQSRGSGRKFGIRWHNWKMISGLEAGTRELYDLTLDAGETNNLADSQPEHVKGLEEILEGLRSNCRLEAPTGAGPVVTPEDDAALRSLGYVQ